MDRIISGVLGGFLLGFSIAMFAGVGAIQDVRSDAVKASAIVVEGKLYAVTPATAVPAP